MEERNKRGIGWFELVVSCIVTAVVCVTATYVMVKRNLAEQQWFRPIVVDFKALSVGQFNRTADEVKAKGLSLEQSDELFKERGRELALVLKGLAGKGYVVFDKNKLLFYPQEIDATELIAKRLGITVSSDVGTQVEGVR